MPRGLQSSERLLYFCQMGFGLRFSPRRDLLDGGVDVPAVGLIILAGGGKAEVALRQRIGRGLRAKKFGPNV
ncbi:hypothetical protein I8Q59_09430, partial [Acinetobacter baumannii]|nr:hypothetical protein [Acinetobacter baumannii]